MRGRLAVPDLFRVSVRSASPTGRSGGDPQATRRSSCLPSYTNMPSSISIVHSIYTTSIDTLHGRTKMIPESWYLPYNNTASRKRQRGRLGILAYRQGNAPTPSGQYPKRHMAHVTCKAGLTLSTHSRLLGAGRPVDFV